MAPAPKKIPVRQCVGCREHRPKRELVRVVRSPEGKVSLDFSGKANGRGAYVCRDAQCLKKALRSNALGRSLEVTIPQEVQASLLAGLEELEKARADAEEMAAAAGAKKDGVIEHIVERIVGPVGNN